jgi:hypothetical protein
LFTPNESTYPEELLSITGFIVIWVCEKDKIDIPIRKTDSMIDFI